MKQAISKLPRGMQLQNNMQHVFEHPLLLSSKPEWTIKLKRSCPEQCQI